MPLHGTWCKNTTPPLKTSPPLPWVNHKVGPINLFTMPPTSNAWKHVPCIHATSRNWHCGPMRPRVHPNNLVCICENCCNYIDIIGYENDFLDQIMSLSSLLVWAILFAHKIMCSQNLANMQVKGRRKLYSQVPNLIKPHKTISMFGHIR